METDLEYIFVWEINGHVRLGISENPSRHLRQTEAELGHRASRVFSVPVRKTIDGAVRSVLSAVKSEPTFTQAKELICSASYITK